MLENHRADGFSTHSLILYPSVFSDINRRSQRSVGVNFQEHEIVYALTRTYSSRTRRVAFMSRRWWMPATRLESSSSEQEDVREKRKVWSFQQQCRTKNLRKRN